MPRSAGYVLRYCDRAEDRFKAVRSRRRTSALGRIAAFESDKHIVDTPFSMDFAKVSASH